MRNLVLVLGDQLDRESAAFDGFDAKQDRVLMIEAIEESTHVWSHKTRTALFLSAMRHFAKEIEARGWPIDYRALDRESDASLASGLAAAIEKHKAKRVICVEPGDLRVRASLEAACAEAKCDIEIRIDRHFLCTVDEFKQWAGKNKSLRMEFFYREMRKRHRVLMDGDNPIGGQWNFD
ncbi:MAG: cryptochrome/photolyase family protein, partial [Casimicrobium sp.]